MVPLSRRIMSWSLLVGLCVAMPAWGQPGPLNGNRPDREPPELPSDPQEILETCLVHGRERHD
jgi:hypothetical protein